ncbi:hypothetical protein PCANC_26896 [Puccinia coronata f. sp. avenae]|uniref:Uncharacterized protein n=1 Tax=Puccinia coronata f. sp. avenae TaxID=200324 RepID=A0A2N5S371_9BASI|nr:hypothetical protein PCANC_26896 [Puccinia coronata f. sp. avenae]
MLDKKYNLYIVNGVHQEDWLRELLGVFIDKTARRVGIGGTWTTARSCACSSSRTRCSKKKLNQEKVAKAAGNDAAGALEGGSSLENGHNSKGKLNMRIEGKAVNNKTTEATSMLKDQDWSVDTSAEAVKEHMESLEAGTQNSLSRGNDDAKENPGNPMPSSMNGSYPTVEETVALPGSAFLPTKG